MISQFDFIFPSSTIFLLFPPPAGARTHKRFWIRKNCRGPLFRRSPAVFLLCLFYTWSGGTAIARGAAQSISRLPIDVPVQPLLVLRRLANPAHSGQRGAQHGEDTLGQAA